MKKTKTKTKITKMQKSEHKGKNVNEKVNSETT